MKSIQIEKDRYVDSVLLMAISRDLKALPGVKDAVVVLATPANKEALARTGFVSPELDRAGPNDLAIAVDAENGAARRGRARQGEGAPLAKGRGPGAGGPTPTRYPASKRSGSSRSRTSPSSPSRAPTPRVRHASPSRRAFTSSSSQTTSPSKTRSR